MNTKSVDLDLRIKAGAALTCDLSTRVGGHLQADSNQRVTRVTSFVADEAAARPLWLRVLICCGFAVAIGIPWVLLLVDQLTR